MRIYKGKLTRNVIKNKSILILTKQTDIFLGKSEDPCSIIPLGAYYLIIMINNGNAFIANANFIKTSVQSMREGNKPIIDTINSLERLNAQS